MTAWLAAPGTFWLAHVLPWLVDATLVSALVLILCRLGRRWTSHLRSALTTLALVDLALPPLLVPGAWAAVLLTPAALGLGVDGETAAAASTGTLPSAGLAVASAVAILHLAGAVAVAMRCSRHLWRLRRVCGSARQETTGPLIDARDRLCLRLGIRRRPPVLITAEVTAPCIAGLFSPVVLWPAPRDGIPMEARDLEALLAHELLHLRARDLPRAWLGALVSSIWWFHPLARRLVRVADEVCEERCDDEIVARALATPASYGRALFRAARAAASRPVAVAGLVPQALGDSPLCRRLERLATPELRRGVGLPGAWRLALTGALLMTLSASVFDWAPAGVAAPATTSAVRTGDPQMDRFEEHRARHRAQHRARHRGALPQPSP